MRPGSFGDVHRKPYALTFFCRLICYFKLLPFWSDGFQIPASALL
jgi:hypothetical protein